MPALLDAQRKTRGERPTWRRMDKQKNRITVISRATISSGRLPGLHCPGLLFLPPSEPLAPPIPVSPGSPASPVFCLALSLHPRFTNPRHFERACRKSSPILYATSRPFSYSFYPLPSLPSSSTIVLFAPSIPFNAVSSRSQYGSVSRDFDSQTLKRTLSLWTRCLYIPRPRSIFLFLAVLTSHREPQLKAQARPSLPDRRREKDCRPGGISSGEPKGSRRRGAPSLFARIFTHVDGTHGGWNEIRVLHGQTIAIPRDLSKLSLLASSRWSLKKKEQKLATPLVPVRSFLREHRETVRSNEKLRDAKTHRNIRKRKLRISLTDFAR